MIRDKVQYFTGNVAISDIKKKIAQDLHTFFLFWPFGV